MGNSIGRKRKTAKVMKIDGTIIRLPSPALAADALRDHPSFSLLDADEVRHLGVRARPLDPSHPLKPGRLYFLVELPRLHPDPRAPRRNWSGALHLGARDRLESLALQRRSVSDLSVVQSPAPAEKVHGEGAVRVRMRLPKKQVARLMEESRNAEEAAEKIAELCVAGSAPAQPSPPPPPRSPVTADRRVKRTRFLPIPDEITT